MFKNHPVARQKTVRLQDLADERWMVDKTADGEGEALDRALRAAGLTPQILHGEYAALVDDVLVMGGISALFVAGLPLAAPATAAVDAKPSDPFPGRDTSADRARGHRQSAPRDGRQDRQRHDGAVVHRNSN
ncbi:LysR substrate-binding domain-containing protein [Streptomyces sp. NPDC006662]|uniref:LysR substrate-binding domain-containing protein n=1 Tax=Streptomyces sp. NPDC006662 TaxID=3156902 RepID=UPI0033E7A572